MTQQDETPKPDVTETPAPQDAESVLAKAQQEAEYWKAKYEAEVPKRDPRLDSDDPNFWKNVYMGSIGSDMARDEETRGAHDLRITMVKLIEQIGTLIQETAEQLQFIRAGAENWSPFEIDEILDVVSWQVAEFCTLAHYDRTDEVYEYVVRGKQWTRDHAIWWFDVLETYDDPPKLWVRDPRTPKPAPEADEDSDQDENDNSPIGETPDQPDDAPDLRLVS